MEKHEGAVRVKRLLIKGFDNDNNDNNGPSSDQIKELFEGLRKVQKFRGGFWQRHSLTIIHCQHARGNWLIMVPVNFSFLPHMLQQQQSLISNWPFFFVVFKNVLVYVATVTLASSSNWLIISCMAPEWERGDGDMVLMHRVKKHIEAVLGEIRELSEFGDYVSFIPILIISPFVWENLGRILYQAI